MPAGVARLPEIAADIGAALASWPVFQQPHMSFLAFFFIVVSLLSFVVAQLILKRAMKATTTTGFRNVQFAWRVSVGIVLMAISFFLTLGLLQRFDLSYLYPFQGLSVIFITLTAAVVLKEKLNARLTIGALLISIGIVLVSLS
ncbi:MAG: EamA family transporter [Verrucomicrobia bacterium]|nr:EamA family transporter [Verrucomicrobiota bacterium]